MFERRPMVGLLIALTLCISIWRISVQESVLYNNGYDYGSQGASDEHRLSPTAYELKHTQPPSQQQYRYQHRPNNERQVSEGRTTSHNIVGFTPSTASQSTPTYDYESLLPNDYTTLIDLEDFKFLINQPPCTPKGTAYFLVLVHSAPRNQAKRKVIRETWGSVQGRQLRLLFLVGSVDDRDLQYELEKENSQFKDMVQGNFADNYRNLTYKHVMALKWFLYHCPEAKYLIKTDDDVFVNTLQLLEYVDMKQQLQHQPSLIAPFTPRTYHVPSNSSSINGNFSRNASRILNALQPKNFLFCLRQGKARVKRSYRSKWRVSTREFAGRYYPVYCPGYSIMYSPDVVYRLYKEAQRTKYFWIDDVHITGTLAQRFNIKITSLSKWLMSRENYSAVLSGDIDISRYTFLFANANLEEKEIRDIWAMTVGQFNLTRSYGGGAYKYDSFR